MRGHITKRLVQDAKPKSKPYEVRDERLKGFILRVQPSGRMSYVVEYGRGRRVTIGSTVFKTAAEARNEAASLLGMAASGRDPREVLAAQNTPTLREFINGRYKEWAVHNRKTGSGMVARIAACFFDSLGDKELDKITAWQAEKWRSARLKAGIKPATANKDLGTLKSALNRAVEWGLLESSPLSKIKPQTVDQAKRVRFLSVDEEQALRSALDARETRLRRERDSGNEWREARGLLLLPELGVFVDHLRPLVLLAINTGMRRGELLSLRWTEVDLEGGNLTVRGEEAKSGQTRHIPLNTEAKDLLRKWREQTGGEGLVFPAADGGRLNNFKKSWAGVLKIAGLEYPVGDSKRFRFHDVRHTFASRLVMAGVPLNTVRELLGHSDLKMTLRYAHLAPDHKAEAVELLNSRAVSCAEGDMHRG